MDDITPEEESRLLRIIGRGLVLSDIIDPAGMSEDVYLSTVKEWVSENPEAFENFDFIANWERDLIEYAQLAKESGKAYISCMFYATWFEHWLNSLIAGVCIKKGLSDAEKVQIIRDSNNRSKTSWVLKLLALPPMDQSVVATASQLIEKRNSFVHYKWNHTEEQSLASNLENLIRDFENATEYLENYRSIHLFGGF